MLDFHKHLPDNYEKLRDEGYNLAYYDNDKELKIFATTNYQVNTKLNQDSIDNTELNKSLPRAETIVYGVTGTSEYATFAQELTILNSLQRENIPKDMDFIPINMSMDVGTASASVLYLNGFDARYMVSDGMNYYPTRIITKGEIVSDPKNPMHGDSIKERYKRILRHIQHLSRRFPEIKKGITLHVDGSAIDTIELLKTFVVNMRYEDPAFDLED